MPNRGICFVCGSPGAELSLYIKSKDKGPYFPFLEHHDPPKGSRLPGPDGIVDSCRVCFAFLTQQWEAYERNKTPAIKRLYWLKRADNGHFTGAEMKLQGEYMAQVMGLQYQTGSNDQLGSMSPVDRSSYSRENFMAPTSQVDPVCHRMGGTEGALDLSLPSNKVPSDTLAKSHATNYVTNGKDTFFCLTCGFEKQATMCKIISAVKHSENEPYFSFLEKIIPPRGSMPLSSQGLARVCEHCFSSLYQQWLMYERAGAPTSARRYNINEDHLGRSQHTSLRDTLEQEKLSVSETCYLCGQPHQMKKIKSLYTVPSHDNKLHMYFPFIRELRRPQGARPLNPDGTVLVCHSCHGNLQNQWRHYEAEKIPPLQRRYSLLPVGGAFAMHIPQAASSEKHVVKDPDVENKKGSSNGSDITQPLNIQISKSPPPSVQGTSQGLLAIAQCPVVKTEVMDPPSSQCSMSTSPASNSVNNVLAAKVLEHHRQLTEGKVSGNVSTVPHPLQQAGALPKKVCFICGEKCLITKAHILCSYPVRHEAKTPNSQVLPFFPFLVSRDAAAEADPMTDDGTVLSCSYCYSLLHNQWKEYEESRDPDDHKRWVRKYSTGDFVCYVCGRTVSRRKIRTLEVHKLPFLKEHNAPPHALMVDNEAVAACSSCTFSLTHQYAEYERMGVPHELRKYNWIQQAQGPLEGEDNSNDSRDQDAKPVEDKVGSSLIGGEEDSDTCQSEGNKLGDSSAAIGVPQGSKPPPLTMLSPAGTKVTRNTATVPPLNQVSPSNGLNSVSSDAALSATRTSSFAAALRKLAHQAKDPADEVTIKQCSPPSSNISPRSATPKRAPPPLVYASQSSTLTSPPVVTIAPTQTHSTALNSDGRLGIDRVPSAHSTTSSSYEPLALKQEREQLPLSSHSRDDDRLTAKDGPLVGTPSRIVTPHSTPGTTQGAIGGRDGREESQVRGFQPYRGGEEMRHPGPHPFGMDPAYSYHPAFLQPHPYPHPAYRFEDPLLIERYRMMQPPFLPFSTSGGMLPHPGMHPLLPGNRYPQELLHQQYAYMSPSAASIDHRSPALSAERSRVEEERQREVEREREREREREKEKEKDREAEIQRMREHHRDMEREKQRTMEKHVDHTRDSILSVPARSRQDRLTGEVYPRERGDNSIGPKFGSITQGTPRDREYAEKCRTEFIGVSEHGYPQRVHDDVLWRENHKIISHNHDKNHFHLKHQDQVSPRHFNSGMADTSRRYLPDQRLALDQGKAAPLVAESSRGQPPPLISPRSQGDITSVSKNSEGTIFRPFEKGILGHSQSGYQYSDSGSSSKLSEISVPAFRLSADREQTSIKDSHGDKRDGSSVLQLPNGSTRFPLKKTDNSCQSNQSAERFEFRNLATEFSSHVRPALELHSREQVPPLPPFSDTNQGSLQSDQVHIRSKLDLEEKKLHEARLNGTYCSDSEDETLSDEEERRVQRLLLITQGPPLKLDVARNKMKFLGELGLTSHRRKRDLQFERFRKRRKLYRERSVSPIEIEEENRSPLLGPPSHIDPEDLCREVDYHDKCIFLQSLSLGSLGRDRRKELGHIRQVCEDERQRRHGLLEMNNHQNSDGSDSGSEQKVATGRGVKRKHGDTNSSLTSEKSEPVKISLNQLHERHLVARQKLNSQSNHHHKSTENRAVVFPEARDRDRQLSREFAEQFHESVLQTTRQKELASRLGMPSSRPDESHGASDQTHYMTSFHRNRVSSRNTDSSEAGSSMRWPGLEAILESYHNYVEEQKLEKQVLVERCRRLRSENLDLNRAAERLSHRMSILLEAKQRMEEGRGQSQSAIDNLKRCIRYLR